MKYIFVVFLILCSAALGTRYGYKQATTDDIALIRYVEMANSYAHLKVLDKGNPDNLRKFIIDDLRLTVSIHKFQMEEQSVLSEFFGPQNEALSGTNRSEYYIALKAYFESRPKTEENQSVLNDLQWLLHRSK